MAEPQRLAMSAVDASVDRRILAEVVAAGTATPYAGGARGLPAHAENDRG
ncbi:hypothetical protein ACQPYK_38715 [Streptosporangium sp. CA-135522]